MITYLTLTIFLQKYYIFFKYHLNVTFFLSIRYVTFKWYLSLFDVIHIQRIYFHIFYKPKTSNLYIWCIASNTFIRHRHCLYHKGMLIWNTNDVGLLCVLDNVHLHLVFFFDHFKKSILMSWVFTSIVNG